MRALRFLAVLPAIMCSQAFAADGSLLPASSKFATDSLASSKIEAVTVFPSGAEITRTLKVKLGAGEQTVLVNDVTGQAIAASIRVEGTADRKLEIGSVDARRVELPSTDPAVTRTALSDILTRLKARGVAVLLCGMLAPPNYGKDYADRFNAIYPDLAKSFGVSLYPFFLDGVAADAKLNQADGIHPTPAGIDVIVETIMPTVEAFLGTIKAQSQ